FYGQAPGKWKYGAGSNASMRYAFNKHFYSDTVFYFLTVDNNSPGKRIQTATSSTLTTNYTVNSFDDFQLHEVDGVNLVKSGREMYGENFENASSFPFNFNFPNLQNDTIWIKTNVLGQRVDTGNLDTAAYDISYGVNNNVEGSYQ